MAKYIPGPIGTDFRGSIGATTYSHNRGGNFARTRIKPKNPKSPAQIAVRASFKTMGPAWKNSLTDAQRLAWYQYGQDYPTSTTLWPHRPNAGYEAFCQVNMYYAWFGYPLTLDPPPDRNVTQLGFITLTFVPGITPQLLLTSTLPAPTEQVWLYTSPANSPGRLYAWARHLQFSGGYTNTAIFPLDIAPNWVATWGAIPPNKRIGVQLVAWNYVNGALSRRLATSVITS